MKSLMKQPRKTSNIDDLGVPQLQARGYLQKALLPLKGLLGSHACWLTDWLHAQRAVRANMQSEATHACHVR